MQQPLALTGQSGVYVLCYARAEARAANGAPASLLLHIGYHFDTHKRIDFGWMTTQPVSPL